MIQASPGAAVNQGIVGSSHSRIAQEPVAIPRQVWQKANLDRCFNIDVTSKGASNEHLPDGF